jgi:pilus assembly protein Flp/PilA
MAAFADRSNPRWQPVLTRQDARAVSTREFSMLQRVSRFLRDQSGATAIEYCLIAAGLSIVIITAINSIGTTLNAKFTSVNTSLK